MFARAAADVQRDEDLALLQALIDDGHGPDQDFEEDAPDLTDDVLDLDQGRAPRRRPLRKDRPADAVLPLSERERAAFQNMRNLIAERRINLLSDKQRGWAERRAAELGITYGDPAQRNAHVPVGRPVRLTIQDMPRPLRPPGRK